MTLRYQYRAKSSTDGQIYRWTTTALDPTFAGFTGPGSPLNGFLETPNGFGVPDYSQTGSEVAGAVATHVSAADPHTQYPLTNGASVIQDASGNAQLNTVVDMRDFGMSGSIYQTFWTGTAGQNTITLSATDGSFKIGQWVCLFGAGAATGMTQPAAPPALHIPSVGSTSYTFGAVGFTDTGGYTSHSSGTINTTTGPATLTESTPIFVDLPAVTGAYGLIATRLASFYAANVMVPAITCNQDLTNSTAWTRNGLTVTTGQADPDGGTNAVLLTESGGTVQHYLRQTLVYNNGEAAKFRVWFKQGTGRYVAIRTGGQGGASQHSIAWFDLQAGVAGTSLHGIGTTPSTVNGVAIYTTSSITSDGAGGYWCEFLIASWQPGSPLFDIVVTNSLTNDAAYASGGLTVYCYKPEFRVVARISQALQSVPFPQANGGQWFAGTGTAARANALFAKITGVSGTTLTLDTNLITGGSGYIRHEDGAALEAKILADATASIGIARTYILPSGSMYFNRPCNIEARCVIVGHGGQYKVAAGQATAPTLIIGLGLGPVMVVHVASTSPHGYDGAGDTVLRDFAILGGSGAGQSGVGLSTNHALVTYTSISGQGLALVGSGGANFLLASSSGIVADTGSMTGCAFSSARRYGIWTTGVDSQCWRFQQCTAKGNGCAAIYEGGFLGNSYDGIQTQQNGLTPLGGWSSTYLYASSAGVNNSTINNAYNEGGQPNVYLPFASYKGGWSCQGTTVFPTTMDVDFGFYGRSPLWVKDFSSTYATQVRVGPSTGEDVLSWSNTSDTSSASTRGIFWGAPSFKATNGQTTGVRWGLGRSNFAGVGFIDTAWFSGEQWPHMRAWTFPNGFLIGNGRPEGATWGYPTIEYRILALATKPAAALGTVCHWHYAGERILVADEFTQYVSKQPGGYGFTRANSTAYRTGWAIVDPSSKRLWKARAPGGTSGGSTPTFPTSGLGATVVDGTITWEDIGYDAAQYPRSFTQAKVGHEELPLLVQTGANCIPAATTGAMAAGAVVTTTVTVDSAPALDGTWLCDIRPRKTSNGSSTSGATLGIGDAQMQGLVFQAEVTTAGSVNTSTGVGTGAVVTISITNASNGTRTPGDIAYTLLLRRHTT
jgi:hypothetical protein